MVKEPLASKTYILCAKNFTSGISEGAVCTRTQAGSRCLQAKPLSKVLAHVGINWKSIMVPESEKTDAVSNFIANAIVLEQCVAGMFKRSMWCSKCIEIERAIGNSMCDTADIFCASAVVVSALAQLAKWCIGKISRRRKGVILDDKKNDGEAL